MFQEMMPLNQGGGETQLNPILIDSANANPSAVTITLTENMTNAMVIITYSAYNTSYYPSTEAALDARVTLPATADQTIFYKAGHMAQKIYYYKQLNSGDAFTASPYNTTYGVEYIELIQL